MQRKATKNTRLRNTKEAKYQAWVKYQPCSFCGSPRGSIVDHCKGSTFKHQGLLIGHWFVNSKCQDCDDLTTQGSHNRLVKHTGMTDAEATLKQMERYEKETGFVINEAIKGAIHDVYAVNENITDWDAVL